TEDANLQHQAPPQQKTEAEQRTDTFCFPTAGARGNSRYRGGGGSVHVDGYYRKDGTYVHSYNRAAPGTVSHSSSEASYGTPTYSSGVARNANGRIDRETLTRGLARQLATPFLAVQAR